MSRMNSAARGANEIAQDFRHGDMPGFELLTQLPGEVDEPFTEVKNFLGVDYDVTSTPREAAEGGYPLREPYSALAWSVFYLGKRHIEAHVPAEQLERYSTLTDVRGEALSGIRSMVAYANLLPFAYAGQRLRFPDAPTDSDERLADLRQIALASVRTLSTMAAAPAPIEREIEIDTFFESLDSIWGVQASLMEGKTTRLKMAENEDGCLEISVPRLKDRLEGLAADYTASKGITARGTGCAALRSTMEDGQTTPFEVYWQTIVDVATTDPHFFAADLDEAYDYRREYGYDRRAAYGIY